MTKERKDRGQKGDNKPSQITKESPPGMICDDSIK